MSPTSEDDYGKTQMGDFLRSADSRREDLEATSEDLAPDLSLMCVQVGSDIYALPMAVVDRLIAYTPVTPVPATPPHVVGVISLRGGILAIIDLRIVLGLGPTASTSKSRILVARTEQIEVGIVVDRVLRLATVRSSEIHPPLSTLERFKREFIKGELLIDDQLMVVLDLAAVIRASRQRLGTGTDQEES